MITKTFKLTIATDTKKQMQKEEEHLSMIYGAEEVKEDHCEDCISREAVNTLVDELARAINDERCCISRGRNTATIMQDILDLPSVTTQPKIGRWEMCEDSDGIYGVCSECGQDADFSHYGEAYCYCPNCGAKMVEPQESEDKE